MQQKHPTQRSGLRTEGPGGGLVRLAVFQHPPGLDLDSTKKFTRRSKIHKLMNRPADVLNAFSARGFLKRNNTTQGEKIYFDLSLFKVLFWLDRGDLNEIRKASKVNMEQYKGTKRHFR